MNHQNTQIANYWHHTKNDPLYAGLAEATEGWLGQNSETAYADLYEQ